MPSPIKPSLTVIKTLFALSGNVCAFFDADRSMACEEVLTHPSWIRVRARICHISGLRPGAARYDPSMTDTQRNAFENLLLLCPNHHALVDDLQPHEYTVERLRTMKNRSEQRGGDTLGWASEDALYRFAQLLWADLGLSEEPRGAVPHVGEDPVASFGAALRRLREERGHKRRWLADRVAVSESTIGRWERGESFPHRSLYAALEEVLDVDPGWVSAFSSADSNRSTTGLPSLASVVDRVIREQGHGDPEEARRAASDLERLVGGVRAVVGGTGGTLLLSIPRIDRMSGEDQERVEIVRIALGEILDSNGIGVIFE